jgi:hypothetical protein
MSFQRQFRKFGYQILIYRQIHKTRNLFNYSFRNYHAMTVV